MENVKRFLNEPRLSMFKKICEYDKTHTTTNEYFHADIYITVILIIYPDLLWMVPYDFKRMKHNTYKYFGSKYNSKYCWIIYHSIYDKLRGKKLIID